MLPWKMLKSKSYSTNLKFANSHIDIHLEQDCNTVVAERNKKSRGRRLKIKLDIPSPPPPPSSKRQLPSFFVRRRQHLSVSGIWIMEYWEWATNTLDQYYLEWHQQQKLHRTAFHRPVGEGGSAD